MDWQERFWAKVEKTDSCWLWTGASKGNDYGQISIEGVTRPAHRVSLLLAGIDPSGKVVHHTCHVRRCVNPDHLELHDSWLSHMQEHRLHTRETVISDIVGFHSEYGRTPTATDWNTGVAKRLGHEDRLRAWHAHDWPPTSVVVKLFGSWGNAIEAAGFPRPPRGRTPPK